MALHLTMTENFYWEQIERYFVKKRGNALILSPKDWPLITSWQAREIPLEVIFEGIDKAFIRLEEKQTTPRRTILTLAYCQHDVEKAWKAWKDHHAEFSGKEKRETFTSDEHQKLATKLRSTANQLQKYAANPYYQCIHDELIAASEMLESLIPFVELAEEQTTLAAIKDRIRTVEQQLAAHLEQAIDAETRRKQNMNESVYRETLQLAFIQELRNAYPLPSFL